jgi:hypothetical protein
MPTKTKLPLGLTSTLRQVRHPVLDVKCRTCGRAGSYDRAEIVKKHGASISFARLRRMSAMGCERLNHVDGDRCGTWFPCLGSKDDTF